MTAVIWSPYSSFIAVIFQRLRQPEVATTPADEQALLLLERERLEKRLNGQEDDMPAVSAGARQRLKVFCGCFGYIVKLWITEFELSFFLFNHKLSLLIELRARHALGRLRRRRKRLKIDATRWVKWAIERKRFYSDEYVFHRGKFSVHIELTAPQFSFSIILAHFTDLFFFCYRLFIERIAAHKIVSQSLVRGIISVASGEVRLIWQIWKLYIFRSCDTLSRRHGHIQKIHTFSTLQSICDK